MQRSKILFPLFGLIKCTKTKLCLYENFKVDFLKNPPMDFGFFFLILKKKIQLLIKNFCRIFFYYIKPKKKLPRGKNLLLYHVRVGTLVEW